MPAYGSNVNSDLSSPASKAGGTTAQTRGNMTTPWYRRDRYGWPIDTFKGKPFQSFMRILCQNIRKITG